MKQWQKYVAELLGTFTLVFVGSLSILTGGAGSIGIAFGFGLALLAGLYAFGEVSGGHFNPIVSLAMFLDRRLTALETIWYWVSQIVGAICASLVIWIAYANNAAVDATATRVPPTSSEGRAFIMELVCSAIFVAVILQVTKSSRYGASTLIAIPLTLVAIHLAILGSSGSSVNPARTLGPDIVGATAWADIWIYLLAPFAGAIVGWAVHMVTVRGDTSLRDDLGQAVSDFRGVEMDDLRQGPGQVPPPGSGAPPTA